MKPLKNNRIENITFQGKPALKITLYHFMSSVEDWEVFIRNIDESLSSSEAIIIDARNHIGGRLDYAHEISALLYGVGLNGVNFTQYFPMLLNSTYTIRTALSDSGKTIVDLISENLGITRDESLFITNKIDGAKCLGPGANSSVIINPTDILREPYDPKLIYQHPIYLIMGKNCHSACELMVSNLLQHPNVTTVGENTGGTIHFATPLIYSLPNSQITITIPNTFIQFKGNPPFFRGAKK